MNAAHRHTGVDPHTVSPSGSFTSRAPRDPRYSSAFEVLSDRQLVIAVMASNGRTNHQISLRLKLPVPAVEQYLDEASDILRLTSEHEPTHRVITAHPSKTSPIPEARTTSQDTTPETHTSTPSTAAPEPAPQPLGPKPAPAPALLSALEAEAGTRLEAVRVLVPESDRDLDDEDPDRGKRFIKDQNVEYGRELIAVHESLKQEHETIENLEKAVLRRDVIGQAKGILMERYKISADAAFAILQDESSRSNHELVDVAMRLTRTG